LKVADRHKVEHEIYHVAPYLARWSQQHVHVLLFADLRHLHRVAAGVSLDWELLGPGAQAAKDAELLALTRRCHPQSLRQMRWANAMLKVLSHQVLSS
jgi:hypothetical protein